MSVFRRLYRGETNIQFIRARKRWYLASAVLILICIGSMVFRGFNFGIDFAGGTKFQLPTSANGHTISAADVDKAFSDAGVSGADPAQQVGSGSTATITIQSGSLDVGGQQRVQAKVAPELGLQSDQISIDSVGSDWGHDVTVKAIEGLLVFLVVVSIYISFRFQWRMAIGGMVALLHDLVLTAGVYSLVGFEVTPSTVVGLLTILGFSLYDTVVVYDKVAENSKDLLAGSRMTYSDAANLAVNQTLMRSINTSLIALLPVAGLLFVGAGLLGVGTIKDLALVLFVGLATGAYSSLFLATPIVVDLTEHTPEYRALTKRVVAKRSADARREAENAELIAAGLPPRAATRRTGAPAPAPRPGARPARQRRKR
jgi:preprotein translocase subunit SecF